MLALIFLAGLKVGGFIQHQKTGFFYVLRSEKTYASSFGAIKLRYATEAVGAPFLDPGTSTIVLEDPSGLELTVYKAKRGFQESFPFPEDVRVQDSEIRWDDGRYAYTLLLSESEKDQLGKDP